MQIRNIHNAKSHLSKLVDLASKGEEILICKAGKSIAVLVKHQKSNQPRVPGYWEGRVHIAEDFDELPEAFTDVLSY